MLAILGGIRHAPQAVPWLVGLTITAAYWFTSSTSFANPAVTLARGFTTTFAGIALDHVPGFVAAQLAGAAVAAMVAIVLFPAQKSGNRFPEKIVPNSGIVVAPFPSAFCISTLSSQRPNL